MIISGTVKNFCIFETVNAVINITDKTMVIIVKINLVYDTMNEIIGKPMEFDDYQKNVIFPFFLFLNLIEFPKSERFLIDSPKHD